MPSACKGEVEVTEKNPSSELAFPAPGPQPLEAESTAPVTQAHTRVLARFLAVSHAAQRAKRSCKRFLK